MSIFGDIMWAIFGRSAKAESASSAPSVQVPTLPSGTATSQKAEPIRTSASPSVGASSTQATVDVRAVVREFAKTKKQKLNYDKSIVDLMKLLDLDSSAAARKKLAAELGYTGDTKSSAKMNVWLHKQVMIKLAANGGKVPKEWMS
jgi:hypothetical protein